MHVLEEAGSMDPLELQFETVVKPPIVVQGTELIFRKNGTHILNC